MIHTKTRSIKVDADLLKAVEAHCEKSGDSINAVVRRYFEKLVRFRKKKPAKL